MATGKIIQADKIQGLADVPNFLSNPNGLLNTSGWTEGSYTAGARPTGSFTASSGTGAFTIGRTTTNHLGVTGTSLVFTKASGNQQGRAVETIFALPLDYRAKVLKLSASYINTSTNATDFVAGSNATDSDMIFYTAYSTDGGTTYTVAEPSSFKLLSNSKDISDTYSGSYQTPYNATHLKLIAYVATTSTTAWSIKAVLGVSPSQYVYGTPITDWQSYTPTWSGSGGTPSLGDGTLSGRWRRVGDNVEIQTYLLWGSTTNGNSSFSWEFSTPSGLIIDSNKLAAGTNAVDGAAVIYDSGTSYYTGVPISVGNAFRVQVNNLGSQIGSSNPMTWVSSDSLVLSVKAPILGWSSSVQMSDSADTRVVAARAYLGSNQTLTGSFSVIQFNSISYDTHGSFDTTNYRYNIRVPGFYRITVKCLGPSTTTNDIMNILPRLNGNVVSQDGFTKAASINERISGTSVTTIVAKSGDYIDAQASLNNSGDLVAASTNNYMTIERISGPQAIAATETIGALYTGAPPTGTISGSYNTVIYGTKVKDSHGAYSGGVYTVPASGQYDISAQVSIQATVTLNHAIEVAIHIDGVYAYSQNVRAQTSATTYFMPQISVKAVPLRAGQTVTIKTYCDGTSLTFQPVAGVNFFSITRSGSY